jgi:hypothetical protein
MLRASGSVYNLNGSCNRLAKKTGKRWRFPVFLIAF